MSQTGKTGHRQRLRERFLANEPGSRSDAAMLELLLTYAIPRQDVRPLAEKLLQQFGSLSALFSASQEELAKCKGVKESSVVLFKAIDAVRGPLAAPEEPRPSEEPSAATTSAPPAPEQEKLPAAAQATQPEPAQKQHEPEEKQPPRSRPKPVRRKKVESAVSSNEQRRKFQLSRGYLLELDQLARLLHSLRDMQGSKKISRAALTESTGLADGSIQAFVSIGSSIGLINAARQTLTEFGEVIAENDIFIESRATLEWCHYVAAASRRNLIWYEIFNTVLADETPMNQEGWAEYFKKALAEQYTDKRFAKHVREEVRFVVDAYLERNFRKLELLHKSPDEKLYRRRYTRFEPLVLCAMLYDHGAALGAQLLQVDELATAPGAPATVFGVDAATLRQLVEDLHNRGWIRYETTHNLDQIRLKASMTALDFLRAHYEHREPQPEDSQDSGELF